MLPLGLVSKYSPFPSNKDLQHYVSRACGVAEGALHTVREPLVVTVAMVLWCYVYGMPLW